MEILPAGGNPPRESIRAAAEVLAAGGVIGLPTDIDYRLAVDSTVAGAAVGSSQPGGARVRPTCLFSWRISIRRSHS